MHRSCATLLMFSAAVATAADADRPPECPRAELYAAAAKLGSPSELPERFSRREFGPVRAISLYESALASDRYRYSALIDEQESQAWVYRYGGYDGSIAWFGPVPISVEQLASCPPAQGPIWLGRNRVLVGARSAQSVPAR